MNITRGDRRIITFYSFKGGVGRSMALANVAFRLADRSDLDVIVVDWDLEAPGLHRFFNIHEDVTAKANGLLEYMLAWREAVEDDADAPPDATQWLIPVTDPKPAHGSLSLLLAGRTDDSYADRLRSFDWLAFYRFNAGAAAIETLREQLARKADMVLVDSRTGVTDSGGICTVQMPDGVVLMTAANEQSFAGLERVARSIAAGEGERAGRERPRVWVVVGRAPYLDVPRHGEDWFEEYGQRFDKGYEEGLWAKADHPHGIRSHRLPHIGRWGFGEQVFVETGPEHDDPLAAAYGALRDLLLQWAVGKGGPDSRTSEAELLPSLGDLRRDAEDAEQRGDLARLGNALSRLGGSLSRARHLAAAAEMYQRAAGIQMGRGDREEYALAVAALGSIYLKQQRFGEAIAEWQRALRIFDELGQKDIESNILSVIGASLMMGRRDYHEADQYHRRAIAMSPLDPAVMGNYAQMLLASGRRAEGLSMLERALMAQGAPSELRVECWFYALAHRPAEQRAEALANVKRLVLQEGARSLGWDFSLNVERARADGHPDGEWLARLADVINEEAEPSVLDAWPAWAAAATDG